MGCAFQLLHILRCDLHENVRQGDEGDENFLSRKELLMSCLLGMYIMNSARKIKDKDNLRELPQIKKNIAKENMSSAVWASTIYKSFLVKLCISCL